MKRILLSLAASTLFFTTYAQINAELGNLINRSFIYFPKIKELNEAVSVTEQKVDLAGTASRPVINASGSYTYVAPVPKIPFSDGNGGTKIIQFQPNHNFNTGISILKPLYDFGKTKLSIERAKQDVQQAKNNVEYNKSQLAAQIADVYYTIIYFQKAISIQDSVIAVLQLNKKQVENKFKNGDALKLDVLTMQNNIDIEQNQKSDLENQLQKQFSLLQFATGETLHPSNISFRFDVNTFSDSAALNLARSNNLEFIIARQKIKQAGLDLGLTKLGTKPAINLNGSTGFRNGFQPDISQFKFNYAIGIGISIPVYDGGRNKKLVQIAESTVKQNQLAMESLNNEFRKNIEQALSDIHSNQHRLNIANDQIAIAREALRVAQSRFTNGISTNIELLNANTNLQKVELTKIQYEYQLTLAKIELARLMGLRYW